MNPDLLHAARRLRESGGSANRRAAKSLTAAYHGWVDLALSQQITALQIAERVLARPTKEQQP